MSVVLRVLEGFQESLESSFTFKIHKNPGLGVRGTLITTSDDSNTQLNVFRNEDTSLSTIPLAIQQQFQFGFFSSQTFSSILQKQAF